MKNTSLHFWEINHTNLKQKNTIDYVGKCNTKLLKIWLRNAVGPLNRNHYTHVTINYNKYTITQFNNANVSIPPRPALYPPYTPQPNLNTMLVGARIIVSVCIQHIEDTVFF